MEMIKSTMTKSIRIRSDCQSKSFLCFIEQLVLLKKQRYAYHPLNQVSFLFIRVSRAIKYPACSFRSPVLLVCLTFNSKCIQHHQRSAG